MVNIHALTDAQLLDLEEELCRLGASEGLPALRARREAAVKPK